MRTDVPSSIVDTAQDLSPDALVSLYEIELAGGSFIRLSPQQETTWQGNTYEDVPCHMTGIGQTSDAEVNRPKFSFANPGGVFTKSLYEGEMDNALITRIRILKADLDADLDFAVRETFRVSRILTLSNQMAVVELRGVLDGQNFRLPARSYIPPEFPHVKLR